MGIEAYANRNASQGQAVRRIRDNHMRERARMLATLAESDAGLVTLYMDKREIQARLREAGLYRLGV